jgi:transglutaminase-like putative cysteine protease
MRRDVSSSLELQVSGESEMAFAVAVARGADIASESLAFALDGVPVEATEVVDRHDTRLHVLTSGAGVLTMEYRATVTGRREPAPLDEVDLWIYRRPSRYCESDTLFPTARGEFRGLDGLPLLAAVRASATYARTGSSLPTDGAVRTLLARRGVCRDYAHLVIALLRARDVPARLAAVYAPGLSPMDFHAVAEAWVDGAWHVVDATGLAPRQSLLRISTGRDASDTAFLSNTRSLVTISRMEVLATVDELPADDGTAPLRLG